MKYANKVHKPFRYVPAAHSQVPGYLQRKFAPLIKASRAKHGKTKVMQ